jgi:lipopolysaccharide/colanic/teichoic acid biosynthesis glycosyltransferase
MIVGAAQYSRPEAIPLESDDRVTAFGKIIRRCRIDEIPQVFNVLRGDMSFVGPRPEAVYRVKEHRALQGIRLSVKPGITGLAQIEGYYHISPRHKLKYDYLYINNRSLALNLKIILKTVLVVLFKPGS